MTPQEILNFGLSFIADSVDAAYGYRDHYPTLQDSAESELQNIIDTVEERGRHIVGKEAWLGYVLDDIRAAFWRAYEKERNNAK